MLRNDIKYFVLGILLVSLLSAGCQKRYWYRQKVDLKLTRTKYLGTVHVTCSNHNPNELIGSYEKGSIDAAYRGFKKIGLKQLLNNVDPAKADYQLHIDIYLDSAVTLRPVSRGIGVAEYRSKAINIDFTFKDLKNKRVIHRFQHDIFYFDYPYRDLGRTTHMVKHSVISLKDDKR
jgi:hypothetical protein